MGVSRLSSLIDAATVQRIKRGVDRAPKIAQKMVKQVKKSIVDGQIVTIIEIDRVKLEEQMRKIAFGLFYHEQKKQWELDVVPLLPDMRTMNGEVDEFDALWNDLESASRKEREIEEIVVDDVFTYTLYDLKKFDLPNKFALRMKFNGGFIVWVIQRMN